MEKVLRVSQLDAAELDADLLSVLYDQLLSVLKLLPSSRLLQFKPELRAALRLLVWWYSVRTLGRTFGQDMLDLRYCVAGREGQPLAEGRRWALLLSVAVDWARDRSHTLCTLLLPNLRPADIQAPLKLASALLSLLSLLNFSLFLLRGRCPSLMERLLGLRLAPVKKQYLRTPNYSMQNQEMIWHGFSEFIFFVLPHINFFIVRNFLRRLLRAVSIPSSSPAPDYSSCAICGLLPTQPASPACGHVYCYYCLQANCMADSNFSCVVCGYYIAESV